MRKIYGIGETVLDIIFKNGEPQAAKPGGSVLNSAVTLGRINLPVYFISEYGKDNAGNLIDDFLTKNGVDTGFVYRFPGNTSIALAFLNQRNDAEYTFYKNVHGKRLDIIFPEAARDDIVQYGSFFAISPEIRERFLGFILEANEKGALVLYDPNFRKSHQSDLLTLRPLIIENMKLASIVRGSDEDFMNIFGAANAEEAWEAVSQYCRCLVYTANADGVFVKTSSYSGKFAVDSIRPVSTIGAGDNFNAGIIASIFRKKIRRENLQSIGENEWRDILKPAVSFATHVCLSYENYISAEFAGSFLK
ncbi:MAG TPA: PfkB family carbohydrate kinase [Bacteroidales bacterium]|nr:PfkB family carbohydrate kinase [Bacteroidales bacterium]